MSMDEQFAQLQSFGRALSEFNTALRTSLAELERNHEAVSPHWQDENRRSYEAVWAPFREKMEQYSFREASAYEAFLERKAAHLRRYLYGN
jgi:uncharacterized protein YukE